MKKKHFQIFDKIFKSPGLEVERKFHFQESNLEHKKLFTQVGDFMFLRNVESQKLPKP